MTTNNAVNLLNVPSPTTLASVKLTPYTASSSASIIIPINTTYTKYQFSLASIVEATTNAKLYLTFSIDGGSNFLSSYGTVYVQTAQDGGPTRGGANNQSQISLTEDSGIDSGDGGYGYYGQIVLYNNIGTQTRVQFNGLWKGSSNSTLRFMQGGAYTPTGSTVNAIKFAMSSGNIASGTIVPEAFN